MTTVLLLIVVTMSRRKRSVCLLYVCIKIQCHTAKILVIQVFLLFKYENVQQAPLTWPTNVRSLSQVHFVYSSTQSPYSSTQSPYPDILVRQLRHQITVIMNEWGNSRKMFRKFFIKYWNHLASNDVKKYVWRYTTNWKDLYVGHPRVWWI